jgi:hypothetical protein
LAWIWRGRWNSARGSLAGRGEKGETPDIDVGTSELEAIGMSMGVDDPDYARALGGRGDGT